MFLKKRIVPLLLGIGLFLLPLALFLGGLFDAWELAVYDAFSRLNTEKEEKSDCVSLILIDTKTLEWGLDYYERYETITGEESVSATGPGLAARYLWPWKREVYERIIAFLARGGARAVAFDLVFDSPHPSGDRQSDLTLAYAGLLQNEEGKTFVVHTLNFRASEDPPADDLRPHEIACLEAAAIAVAGGDASSLPLDRSDQGRFFDPILPYRDIVEEAAAVSGEAGGIVRLGTVTAQIDPDSVIRRARVLSEYDGWFFPSLGLAATLAYWDSLDSERVTELRLDGNDLVLERGPERDPVEIPLTASGDLLVHWKDSGLESYEGSGRFPTYPAYRILLSADEDPRFLAAMAEDPETFRVSPDAFKDRIVFIGASSPGLYDLKATPVSENYPGVKVHAAVAENLLDGDPMKRMPRTTRAVCLAAVTLLIFLTTLYFKSAGWKFLLTVLCMVGYLLAAVLLFSLARLWIDAVAPLAGMAVAYMGGITYNYFTEGRHKREITRMFQHYVPPGVVNKLVARPDALNTRGERVEITVLFSDIQGFTSLSNTKEMRENPDRLTDHLNAYLTEMTGAIHEHGGTLDKYIGDAVVAFFGAPLPMENHAREACRAALACQKRLVTFNRQAVQAGLPELKTRIGLFTGEAMVGNVGSKVRLSYTAIGSTVNFGARLEGTNKVYGTWILAGASTAEKAGEAILTRRLDRVRVPGVVESAPPLEIFEVVSEATEAGNELGQLRERFGRALAAYQAGRFEEAKTIFNECHESFGDPPSRVFATRCAQLVEAPPESWEGVWKITSK